MAFSFSYDWTGTGQDTDWTFSNPDGTTGLYTGNPARRWCIDTNDTPSVGMGPTSGQGGGTQDYIYTEATSPTTANDQFIMEHNTTFDASTNNILISLYTNQRGTDNNATCEIQTNEASAGWVTRATYGGSTDPNKIATNGTDVWVLRTLDLTGILSSASTKIRIVITMPSSGTIWNNDYGLDTISITGTDRVLRTHQLII